MTINLLSHCCHKSDIYVQNYCMHVIRCESCVWAAMLIVMESQAVYYVCINNLQTLLYSGNPEEIMPWNNS